MVDPAPGGGGGVLQGGTRRAVRPRTPVAREIFGQPVEHRAGRAEADGPEHHEAHQHTEHVAVCRQHRMFDHLAQQFGARQAGCIHAQPPGQLFACRGVVACVQRLADLAEVVAELPETQRDVEDAHGPGKGQHRTELPEPPVHEARNGRRHSHGKQPRHPAMRGLAGIEVAAHGARPGAQTSMNRVVESERARLLQQQGNEDGEETHGAIIVACPARARKRAWACHPLRRSACGRSCAACRPWLPR